MTYNPTNWYWIVAGSTTQVFSSAIGDYVSVNDSTYQSWLASNNLPTKIDTENSLGEVLSKYNLNPIAVNVRDGFLNTRIEAIDDIQFRILFNHENRIRTLAAQPTITQAQFIAVIKSMM